MFNMGGLRGPNGYEQARQEQRREQIVRNFAASKRPGSWKAPMFLALVVVMLVGVSLFVVYFH